MEAVASRAQRTARAVASAPLADRAPVLDLLDLDDPDDDRERARSRRRTR